MRHPDRQPLAVEGIDGVVPREDAVLLNPAYVARLARLLLLIEQRCHLRRRAVASAAANSFDQRVLRRKLQTGRAEDRVHARGENGDLLSSRLRAASRAGNTACPGAARPFGAIVGSARVAR